MMTKSESKPITLPEIAEYERLKAEAKKIDAKIKNIGDRMKQQFNVGEQAFDIADETYAVKIIEKRGALNTKLFERDFDVKDFASMYKLVPDTEKIDQILGEDGREYYGTTTALYVEKLETSDVDE